MESQPQNPEFRINPENFHPCKLALCKISVIWLVSVAEQPSLNHTKTCFYHNEAHLICMNWLI